MPFKRETWILDVPVGELELVVTVVDAAEGADLNAAECSLLSGHVPPLPVQGSTSQHPWKDGFWSLQVHH
jgi:hypothetical protein